MGNHGLFPENTGIQSAHNMASQGRANSATLNAPSLP